MRYIKTISYLQIYKCHILSLSIYIIDIYESSTEKAMVMYRVYNKGDFAFSSISSSKYPPIHML